MFEKRVQRWAQRVEKHLQSFDASQFGDPVAMQTKWMPINRGGTNFLTHNLVRIAPHRTEFRVSGKAIVFALTFLSVGMIPVIFSVYKYFANDKPTQNLSLTLLLMFGVIFAGVGVYLLRYGTTPVVFDKQQGYFWKGRQRVDKTPMVSTHQCCAKLEEIQALQLISELCSGGTRNSYYSYELNLVLKSGERLNVIDHGDLAKIREQARNISEFLNKPVWDATK